MHYGKQLRITPVLFFVILLSWSTAHSQIVVSNSFKAVNADADIVVSWKTNDETNVKEFLVERQSSDEPDFRSIGSVPAGKLSLYLFRDHSAFRKATSYYYYRLVIVFVDDSRVMYTEEAGIDHTVSGVRRTWGSIKSMFRF